MQLDPQEKFIIDLAKEKLRLDGRTFNEHRMLSFTKMDNGCFICQLGRTKFSHFYFKALFSV